MTINGIKTNVQAILEATDYFVDVLAAPQSGESYSFTGYPSVSHYYSNTQSDYATVSQNKRIVEYVVEIVLAPPASEPEATKFLEAYNLIDNTIQVFDETIDLSSTALSLSPACARMRPAPGELLPTVTNVGEGLVMTIRLYCEDDITIRNS